MKSDHRYFWIGHSVVGLRVPGGGTPFMSAKPTQLDTVSIEKPSGPGLALGLATLPAARLILRVSAKPQQPGMKSGERQARNALSMLGRTTSSIAIAASCRRDGESIAYAY